MPFDVEKLKAARLRKAQSAPYVPTPKDRKTVQAMVIGGITHERIAAVLGCSLPTLVKHFRKQLDTDADHAANKVTSNLYRMATGKGKDAFNAARFYLSARRGWRSVDRTELTGADGGPIAVEDARELLLGRLGAGDAEGRDSPESGETIQ